MSGTAENSDEIPAFRISPKKVDDSWKEEIRRERERAAAAAKPTPPPAPAAEKTPESQASPSSASAEAEDEEETEGAGEERNEAQPPTANKIEQQQSKIFMGLLANLAQQALMQLGEIESPYTGQREVDLRGARGTIELLGTLQAKTKNNLSPDESEALTEAIHDLHSRFVEVTREMQRQMAAQTQKAVAAGMRQGPGRR